jgi:hypothetical protein
LQLACNLDSNKPKALRFLVDSVKVLTRSHTDFMACYSQWSNLKVLISTSWSWFALDVLSPGCHYWPLLTVLVDRLLRSWAPTGYHPAGMCTLAVMVNLQRLFMSSSNSKLPLNFVVSHCVLHSYDQQLPLHWS